MIVKTLNVPVRYKGVTHPSRQLFEMEDEHFNEEIVKKATVEEEEEMPRYSREADRNGKTAEIKSEGTVKVDGANGSGNGSDGVKDYKTFSRSKLEGIKNDELKAYLDGKEVKYADDAGKKELINLILGE